MTRVDSVDDLHRAVADHGWLVVSSPPGGGRPPTSSTVGLTARGLPELVVLGLPEQVGGALLHGLGDRLLRGERPDDGAPLPGLLDGGVAPVLVTVEGEVVGLPACDVYGDAVRLRQLVWPDEHGRLPWHPGFAHAELQPVMGRPPAAALQVSVLPADGHRSVPDWPLPDDPHLQVLTSRAVADAGATVLMVVCTDDGELRFLDGASDVDPETAVVECLHEALERDPSLVEAVRPLHQGQVAERDGAGAPWQLAPA